MKDCYGREMKKSCYGSSDVMRLLGFQYALKVFPTDEVEAVLKANEGEGEIAAAVDVFMLGYIYGKRAERSRRARHDED